MKTALTIRLKEQLSEKRYLHSISTSNTCASLCVKFGENREMGVIAGLAHDITREYSVIKLIEKASMDGSPITSWEMDTPVLLHGRAGAVVLKNEFNINREAILNAVRVHSTGDLYMDDFAKLLYIADYIEPLREHPFNKKLINCYKIDQIMQMILKSTINYLKSTGRPIAEPSILLYDKLNQKIGNKTA